MDPITALATILQLVGVFRQESGRRDDLDSEKFMAWLETHRHNELKDIMANTFHLQEQVNDILKDDHDKILTELGNISEMVLALSKRFDGVASIGEASPPDQRLPEQAISILYSMHKQQARGLELMPQMGQVIPILIPSGIIGNPPEPQFLKEDCQLLEQLGYLRGEYSSSGNEWYMITREGSQFAAKIPDDDAPETNEG